MSSAHGCSPTEKCRNTIGTYECRRSDEFTRAPARPPPHEMDKMRTVPRPTLSTTTSRTSDQTSVYSPTTKTGPCTRRTSSTSHQSPGEKGTTPIANSRKTELGKKTNMNGDTPTYSSASQPTGSTSLSSDKGILVVHKQFVIKMLTTMPHSYIFKLRTLKCLACSNCISLRFCLGN